MNAHDLLKTEPSDYSFADFVTRKRSGIGVAHPAAVTLLRGVTSDDNRVIYETASVRGAVGTPSVTVVQRVQGKEPDVRIKVTQRLPKAVPRAEFKTAPLFRDSPLLRQGRSSVVPLSEERYRYPSGA